MTRRSFLLAAGGTIAALSGCDRVRPMLLGPVPPVDAGPFVAPDAGSLDNVTHVLNRLGFGPRPGDYARVAAIGVDDYLQEQLAPETIDDHECDRLTRRIETLHLAPGELFEFKEDVLRRDLTRNAVLRATYSNRQLQEVMVEFWTDHFNIDMSKGDCPWLKVYDDREVIRKHALGRFGDLVRASALSPAMLWYLDGRSNRRAREDERPNENYARELLELHTLGVHGGYSQQDVMEVARCLTGWTVRSEEKFGKGRVEFRPYTHDDGPKQVLGNSIAAQGGEHDLDRVLEVVTTHPSTAHFIASRLCRRFIGPGCDAETVSAVAETFATSSGDIRATLQTIFASETFRASRGAVFKRPFRYIVSALRACNAELRHVDGVYDYLQRMGHAPYQYPTPDGYPEDAHYWYGSMLWRWHFARALEENRVPGVSVDWKRLTQGFGGPRHLAAHVLGYVPGAEDPATVDQSSPAVLLGAPSYQWC